MIPMAVIGSALRRQRSQVRILLGAPEIIRFFALIHKSLARIMREIREQIGKRLPFWPHNRALQDLQQVHANVLRGVLRTEAGQVV